ncbi:MAG: anthranilate phosphoribosyltransferase [Pseudomonadota bacterium]
MIRAYISQVVQGENLSPEEMTEAMELILRNKVRPTQAAALLVGLRLKGETRSEIAAAARVMRRYMPRIRVPAGAVVLDRDEINLDEETVAKTCSLVGGETRTFNVSTATALVAAGGGLPVAKFGSRAESTFCGSANVISALGVNLDLTLTEVERCVKQVGLGFLYAKLFHSPLARVTQIREEIGIRTIFNLIGPLSNPAGGESQVLGVYLSERTELMAQVLSDLGCRSAMVVCGQDTLDELSNTGPTRITRLVNGAIDTFDLIPEEVGLRRAAPEEISGGGAEQNAKIIREILEGQPGARRDVVLLNAAAAFMAAGRTASWADGLELAAQSIDSGQAKAKLDQLIAFTAVCGVYQHKDVS